MSKSKLVQALELENLDELERLIKRSKPELKDIARKVVICGVSYRKAGEPYGITKHAIYEFIKRLYENKFGKRYEPKRGK